MKKVLLISFTCLIFSTIFAQKNVAIYWDASYSMKDRKLDRELQFLDNYFKKNTEANVLLLMFSNDVFLREAYKIENADWTSLKNELSNTIYDGSTSYSVLFKDNVDEYLLFTDGLENVEKFKPPTDQPIYIISSSEKVNKIDLTLAAELSSGRFIYLNTDIASVPKKNRSNAAVADTNGFITGSVSSFEGRLPNVNIINQNTNEGTTSDTQGNYKIKADAGDLLIFTFLGKNTARIRVGKSDIIDVTLADDSENLDEVVINAEGEKEELVNTGNGLVDKRRLGYDVQTISADEIKDQNIDLAQAVKGKFTNLETPNQAFGDEFDISQFIGRHKNMTILGNQYGLVVIDGVPISQSDSSDKAEAGAGGAGAQYNKYVSQNNHVIEPSMIHSITYLKGLAATNKYGTLGANGVLLITTKNAAGNPNSPQGPKKPQGTTATYSGNAETISELANTPYIKALKEATEVDTAFNIYLEQRKVYGDDPNFYLDAYDYFLGWDNTFLSNRILSNVYEIGFDSVNILRALAYKQQANNDFKGALFTYNRILKLAPKQSQSHRDMALCQVYANNYNEASKLYNNIDKNIGVNGVVFNGLRKTILNETKNMFMLAKTSVNTSGVNQNFLRPVKYKARIVIEWNDPTAEFELNIINPQNRFLNWPHTQSENSQRIFQEQEEGYGLEEYYLTSSDLGTWTFNVKYFGKSSQDKTPTFLKITTYRNFGYPNQTRSIKVVRLSKKNVEQTIAKLNVK